MKDIIYQVDCIKGMLDLPDNSVDCIITSPPYWNLRDYGVDGQLGLESDFELYVGKLIELFHKSKRVLKDTGTLWVNIGDTYGTQSGNMRQGKMQNKRVHVDMIIQPRTIHKSLLMIPARFALAMIDDGWILRNEIIWHKPNQMPQSANDRFTVDFEKIFFFVQQSKGYYFEQQFETYTKPLNRWGGDKLNAKGFSKWDEGTGQGAYRTRNFRPNSNGRNLRTIWSINTKPLPDAHFAAFPETLVARMIKAGCPENGIVLDPFMGSGTTALVALKTHRRYIGFELNADYIEMAERRLAKFEKQIQLF